MGTTDGNNEAGGVPKPGYIKPQPITSPPAETPSQPGGPRHSRTGLLILLVLALAVGWYVLYRLSNRAGDQPDSPAQPAIPPIAQPAPQPAPRPAPRPETPSPETAVPSPRPLPQPDTEHVVAKEPAPVDPAQLLLDRERAEEQLGEFLERKRALDERGVVEWGDRTYAEVLTLSQAADRAFLDQDYAAAIESYEKAVIKCDALKARLPEALEQLVKEGEEALAAADGIRARRKFGAAVKIDPADPRATTGLKRSKTIERVAQLMASGTAAEEDAKHALALTDFQSAVELDPLHAEAAAAVVRISEAIRKAEFQELMTKGLKSLSQGSFDEAQAIFEKARGFRPDSKEVADALFQVEEARRLARIRELIEQAKRSEQQEEWKQAYDLYKAVIKIDPHISGAIEGKTRAAAHVRFRAQIQYYLDHPKQLETEEGRTSATLTLHEARALTGTGPTGSALLARLDEQVALATTPVAVTLKSDGATRVDVYKVGRFGSFESKTLSLLPGTYTVVGHREGYKDIRLKVNVPPGAEPVQATVSCRDRI